MNLLDLIATANKNIFKTKLRTLFTLLAIMVGSIGLSLGLAIGNGTNIFLDQIISLFVNENQLIVTKVDTEADQNFEFSISPEPYIENTFAEGGIYYLTQQEISQLQELEGVEKVTPEPWYSMNLEYLEYKDIKLTGELEVYRPFNGSSDRIAAGLIEDVHGDAIALSQGFVEALDVSHPARLLRQEVTLVFTNLRRDKLVKKVKVGAILGPTLFINNKVVLSEDLEREVLSFSNISVADADPLYLNAVLTLPRDITQIEIVSLQEQIKELGLTSASTQDIAAQIDTAVASIQAVLATFSGVVIVVAIFGVLNTLLMSVFERTQEIGLMRALGMKRRHIFSLFTTEALFIGFWGSALGYVSAVVLGAVGNKLLNERVLNGIFSFDPFVFDLASVLIVVVSISLICMIAGFFPAWRAARLDPIEALRRE